MLVFRDTAIASRRILKRGSTSALKTPYPPWHTYSEPSGQTNNRVRTEVLECGCCSGSVHFAVMHNAHVALCAQYAVRNRNFLCSAPVFVAEVCTCAVCSMHYSMHLCPLRKYTGVANLSRSLSQIHRCLCQLKC